MRRPFSSNQPSRTRSSRNPVRTLLSSAASPPPSRLEPHADEVQERVVDVPGLQLVQWDLQLEMDDWRLIGRARPRPTGWRALGDMEPGAVFAHEDVTAMAGPDAARSARHRDVHADHAGRQLGADDDVEQPGCRLDVHDHFADDPAGVVAPPRPEFAGQRLVGVWHLGQDQPVDRLTSRVDDPHGQQVRPFRLQELGGVQFERQAVAFVRADLMTVDPHPRRIVDGLEAEEGPMPGRDGQWRQFAPVPGHPLVVGEDLLDYPGNGRSRLVAGRRPASWASRPSLSGSAQIFQWRAPDVHLDPASADVANRETRAHAVTPPCAVVR